MPRRCWVRGCTASRRGLLLASLAGAATVTGGAAGQTPAPAALTPEGAATLRQSWLGARPSIGHGPRVIVRWSVEVGAGGRAGDVALRVLGGSERSPEATGRGTGSAVSLPAEPGTYEFSARLRFEDGDRIGLDQASGGHALLREHPPAPEAGEWADPRRLHAVDVWRPPLADGAAGGHQERRQGQELAVSVVLEPDVDADGYGDETQDLADLRVVSRRLQRGRGRTTFALAVQNRGPRTAHQPRLSLRLLRGSRLVAVSAPRCGVRRCRWPRTATGGRAIDLPPLRRGARHRVRLVVRGRTGAGLRLVASSEGPRSSRRAFALR